MSTPISPKSRRAGENRDGNRYRACCRRRRLRAELSYWSLLTAFFSWSLCGGPGLGYGFCRSLLRVDRDDGTSGTGPVRAVAAAASTSSRLMIVAPLAAPPSRRSPIGTSSVSMPRACRSERNAAAKRCVLSRIGLCDAKCSPANREAGMVEVKLGAGTVVRIEESYEPNFDAKAFFPDWDPAVVERHRDWLVPAHYDEASGFLKLSVHSWLLEDRRQDHPDRHLRRQSQAPSASAEMASDGDEVSRAAEGGRGRARPDRHGDVHPSPRRPCRLEHAARERQMGADVQEREVRVQPRRLRSLPEARQRSRDRSGQRGSFRDSVLPVVEAGLTQMVDGRGPARRGPRGRAPRRGIRPARSPSSSNRAARRRCSAATSCIMRCRSIIPSGTASPAPTPPARARAGARRWSIAPAAARG